MRVLQVASEGLPFSKTGGLADVVEALPKALVAQGHEVAVVMPKYRGTQASSVLTTVTVPMGSAHRSAAIVDGGRLNGVRYFLIADAEYFDREELYSERGLDYPDNGERFAELARVALAIARQLWIPDVIHCHDWQSALVPVLLRTECAADPQLRRVPVVFTVHNMGYQGLFPHSVLKRAGLSEGLFRMESLEYYGKVNYLKGGFVYADYLTTVSRKYAQEIQTEEYGHGLDGVVRSRADRLQGILNGADYSIWDPEVDTLIAARYSAKEMEGKAVCKKDLLTAFRLPLVNLQRPLVGLVSRFADQKGFDLIADAGSTLVKEDVCIVALGTGEPKHEEMLRELAQCFPAKLGVKIGYDNTLAHKIEAGADIFLMPSRYEPCGLNQIYSLRYGTVPVVRGTGGLDDTIEPFDPSTGLGTGFKFYEYTGNAMLAALGQALDVYGDKSSWRRLQANGMAKEFSWGAAAVEYTHLYETVLRERIRENGGSSKVEYVNS